VPVCLPDATWIDYDHKEKAQRIGWGLILNGTERKVHKLLVTNDGHMISNVQCEEEYSDTDLVRKFYLHSNLICFANEGFQVLDNGSSGGNVILPPTGKKWRIRLKN
jgi:hypothetical protein